MSQTNRLSEKGAVKPQATIGWNDAPSRSAHEARGAVPTPRYRGGSTLNRFHPAAVATKIALVKFSRIDDARHCTGAWIGMVADPSY